MLESNVRTPLGGIAAVVAAGALAVSHREIGALAGAVLLALWAFTPAVYPFVAGQLAVVALYPSHGLGWTIPVVELALTLVLLSPSVRVTDRRRQLGVVAIVASCAGLTWVGLLELGTLPTAFIVVAVAGIAAMVVSQYTRVVIRDGGDVR